MFFSFSLILKQNIHLKHPWSIIVDGRAQLPQATSMSRRGASGWRNPPINHRPYPYPLDEGKAINSQIMTRCYAATISLFTIGETKILSLTPHGGITDTTLKPPLKHLQWLGKGKRCIYTSTSGPTRYKTLTQRLWYFGIKALFSLSIIWLHHRRLYGRHHTGVLFFFLNPFVLPGSLDDIG